MLKDKLKNQKEKLDNFANNKRQQLLIKLDNYSTFGVLFNWVVTHWVTIVLSLALSFTVTYYRYRESFLYEELLKKEIQELNSDLKKLEEDRKKLLVRVKDLDKLVKDNNKQNKLVRDNSKTLSTQEKQDLINKYKNRLLLKKAI